jgi:hypothetical protein
MHEVRHDDARGANLASGRSEVTDSIALVRFGDGEIRCAYYSTTVPVVVPLLFPLDRAVAIISGGVKPLMTEVGRLTGLEEPVDLEPVHIWTTSDDAPMWWEAVASRSHSCLWSGSDPYGVAHAENTTLPAPPRKVHRGTPQWIPAEWRKPTTDATA